MSNASTGIQAWAERYDVELEDFFALQDRLAASVIAALEPRLFAAEHERFQNRSADNLDTWGFVMKAMPYVWTWNSAKEIETAQALLKRAIEIDPEYPRANSLLAWTLAARVQLGCDDARGVLVAPRAMAQRPIQRDSDDPWTHFVAGTCDFGEDRERAAQGRGQSGDVDLHSSAKSTPAPVIKQAASLESQMIHPIQYVSGQALSVYNDVSKIFICIDFNQLLRREIMKSK